MVIIIRLRGENIQLYYGWHEPYQRFRYHDSSNHHRTAYPEILQRDNSRWHAEGGQYYWLSHFPECAVHERQDPVWRCHSARRVLEVRINHRQELSCAGRNSYRRDGS